jgi:hypothetical protein
MPVDNEADAVEIADLMAETVNEAFPGFMKKFFNCTDDRSKLISAAREVVAVRGLFLNAKKKYTLRVVEKLFHKPRKCFVDSFGHQVSDFNCVGFIINWHSKIVTIGA